MKNVERPRWVVNWPVYRQLTGTDRLGRGRAVRSPHTEAARPRTETADRVVSSVCPYCAVGCGQKVYVSISGGKERVTQIEGDPDSPVSLGRLCPKGAASKQLVTHSGRQSTVLYRRPVRYDLGAAGAGPGHGNDRRPGARYPASDLARVGRG